MKILIVLLFVLAGAALAEGPAPASSFSSLAKPPVTYEEVAKAIDVANAALKAIEIKAAQAKQVSEIQNVLNWAQEKVAKDLKAQASDLTNARDVCESKLKEVNAGK